jgi:hypothetical protein
LRIRYSHRLFLYAPYLLLLVLAVAAGLRWWSVADALERRLNQANRGREIAPGVTLHFTSENIGGFPFNIDAIFENVTITVNGPRGPIVWHTEHFAMHALTYGREQEIFEAAGRQRLSWTDTEGSTRHFDFIPGSLRASAIAADGHLARFDLDIAAPGSQNFSAARAQLHVRAPSDRNVMDVYVSADVLRLSPALESVLGTDVQDFAVRGKFTQAAKFLPLLAANESWLPAVDSWRRSAGAFELEALEITSGRLQVHAVGKLTLDTSHRMQGSMNLNVADAIAAQNHVRNRFRATLAQLTKDVSSHPGAPLDFQVGIESGNVSLQKLRGTPQAAGSIDPLY